MSGSGSGGSSCPSRDTLIEQEVNSRYNNSIALISLLLLFIGIGIGVGGPYLYKNFSTQGMRSFMDDRLSTFEESGAQTTSQYGPIFFLLAVAFCFLVAVSYVLENQVKDKNRSQAKAGIRTAVGLAWGLFVLTAIVAPIAVRYAKIPITSYYYLIATALVFYFTCTVVIVIFHNKLSNVDPTSKTFNMTDTHNIQNGLIAGVIAYGIGALLML